jgi:uncharacterized membrane protein YtjA (UPF0391 family)
MIEASREPRGVMRSLSPASVARFSAARSAQTRARLWPMRDRAKERAMNFGNMLYWALIFLVIAIVAGVLGFGGVAGTASEVAHVLFWIAIILLIVSLVFGLRRR